MTSQTSNREQPLADALVSTGYTDLFLRADHDAMDRLWTEYSADGFERLIDDPAVGTQARFLAAEVVFAMAEQLPANCDRALVAAAYADAMAHDYMGVANPWGLPKQVGPVGLHLFELGKVATPYLLPLLDDDARVYYGGSEAATVGNSYAYRVKDLAAAFLSAIELRPYGIVKDPVERDQRIEALRKLLEPQR